MQSQVLEAQTKTCVRRLLNARQCKRVLPGGGTCLVALSGLITCLPTALPSTTESAGTMLNATQSQMPEKDAGQEQEEGQQLEQAEILRALGRALLHVVADCMGPDSAAYSAAEDRAHLLVTTLTKLAADAAAGAQSDACKARSFGLALHSLALPAAHGAGRLWRLAPICRALPGAPASWHHAAHRPLPSAADNCEQCFLDSGEDECVWDDVRGVSGAIDRVLDLVCLLLSSGICLVVNAR